MWQGCHIFTEVAGLSPRVGVRLQAERVAGVHPGLGVRVIFRA